MMTPGSELASEMMAACRAAAGEIGAAFARAFDGEFEVTIAEPESPDAGPMPEATAAPGLAITLRIGVQAAAIVLPEACGLVPLWYARPDATGLSKLTTLAQELSMLVLPESVAVDQFQATRVLDLAEWLSHGERSGDEMLLPLELADAEGRKGTAWLVWPLGNPAALLATESALADERFAGSTLSAPKATRIRAEQAADGRLTENALPNYSRSLLRIQVPVTVTLAEKRQAVARIMELGPGSIIQFDKPCEELLELEVGGHKIGKGEAVKVGDKFGLRLTSLIVPEERYVPVGRAAAP